jgi:hypothetical protein
MGATPWGWLLAGGCTLAVLSLVATTVIHPDHRQERYVPGLARADGTVAPGHFEPRSVRDASD